MNCTPCQGHFWFLVSIILDTRHFWYHIIGHLALLQFWCSIICSLFVAYYARVPAASATLDSSTKGCCQLLTDGDELRNRCYDTAAVGSAIVTSLCGTVKGRPLRGGCFPFSGSESWNRFHTVPCVRPPASSTGPAVARMLPCFRPSSSGFFWIAGTAGGAGIFTGYSPVVQNR